MASRSASLKDRERGLDLEENWKLEDWELEREDSGFFCFSGSMTLPVSSIWMVSLAFSFSVSKGLRSSDRSSLGA